MDLYLREILRQNYKKFFFVVSEVYVGNAFENDKNTNGKRL